MTVYVKAQDLVRPSLTGTPGTLTGPSMLRAATTAGIAGLRATFDQATFRPTMYWDSPTTGTVTVSRVDSTGRAGTTTTDAANLSYLFGALNSAATWADLTLATEGESQTVRVSTAAPVDPNADLLSWAPPSGYQNYTVRRAALTSGYQEISGGGGDGLVILPDAIIGPIVLQDFRNVVLIGGSIKALPSAKVNGHDQRLIYLRRVTGTAHIEGVYLDGAVDGAETDGIMANGNTLVMQIQNVHVNGLRGGQTPHNHADVFQTYLGVQRLRIHRLTGSSNYQGIKFELTTDATINMTEVTIRDTNIIGSSWTPTYDGGFMLWHDRDDVCPITYDNVYVDPRGTRPFGQSVWPGETNSVNPVQVTGTAPNRVGRWPNMRVTGEVREGTPPGGDFCPAGAVGIGYVSPGYL